MHPEQCHALCRDKSAPVSFTYKKDQVAQLVKFIKNGYRIQLFEFVVLGTAFIEFSLVDNLPAATVMLNELSQQTLDLGIPIGYVKDGVCGIVFQFIIILIPG